MSDLPQGSVDRKNQSRLAVLRTRWQWVVLVLAIIVLLLIPAADVGGYWLTQLTKMGILIVACLGVHLVTGLCGQVTMAQAAFMGVGSYIVAVLTTRAQINPWLCLPICVLAAGLLGVFFGLPCLRMKGFYGAISTMGASFIILWVFEHLEITGRFSGLGVEPLRLGSIRFTGAALYVLAMVMMILATLFARNIQRTVPGRAFVAIRDNEAIAEVSGIPVSHYKLLAFFVGSAFAGAAGWLWAYSQLWVSPEQFPMHDSLWYIGMMIIGGWGSTTGVFLGVISFHLLGVVISDYMAPSLVEFLPSMANQIRVSLSTVVYGLILVLFVMYQPHGLYGMLKRLRTHFGPLPDGDVD